MSRIFITADTHGRFFCIGQFCYKNKTKKEDILIILGDAGINYNLNQKDTELKKELSELPITLLCIHGNHECRPSNITTYKEIEWRGGAVYMEEEYPNLLFAKDGEIYNLNGKQAIAIGGAYSVDKHYRLKRGWNWWEDEQPSDDIKERVASKLDSIGWKVDIVLSHTCPYKHMPTEAFLPFLDQSTVDQSTEIWLDKIEDKLNYNKWYCGHYHIHKKIDKIEFVYENYIEI